MHATLSVYIIQPLHYPHTHFFLSLGTRPPLHVNKFIVHLKAVPLLLLTALAVTLLIIVSSLIPLLLQSHSYCSQHIQWDGFTACTTTTAVIMHNQEC